MSGARYRVPGNKKLQPEILIPVSRYLIPETLPSPDTRNLFEFPPLHLCTGAPLLFALFSLPLVSFLPLVFIPCPPRSFLPNITHVCMVAQCFGAHAPRPARYRPVLGPRRTCPGRTCPRNPPRTPRALDWRRSRWHPRRIRTLAEHVAYRSARAPYDAPRQSLGRKRAPR